MSEQLQLRRGTASQVAAFTGAQGEAIFNTTTNQLHMQDGATAGGWPANLAVRAAVSNANYSAQITDRIVAYTAISAPRTVTLPVAASFPTGTILWIIDESGSCSPTNAITVNRAGSDTIEGVTSFVLNGAYQALAVESNGVNGWAVLSPLPNVEHALVGIGTAPDPNNVLSAYGASALFNGAGNFNVTVNKGGGAGNVSATASFIFEDGFSGRAQIGLCGNDSFSFKVSPNGGTWTTGILIDAATGAVTLGNGRTAVADANYTALATDRLIAYTAITAARTVSLPAASVFPAGTPLFVIDESGSVSSSNTITVARAGSDTIDGLTSATLATAYAYLRLVSNGSNKWTMVGRSPNLVIFTSSGTYTPTPGMQFCDVYLFGGGGGGGGGALTASGTAASGGGGGGGSGFTHGRFSASTIGTSQSVTVGAGGAGGAAATSSSTAGSNGNVGGYSTIGSFFLMSRGGGSGSGGQINAASAGGGGGGYATGGNASGSTAGAGSLGAASGGSGVGPSSPPTNNGGAGGAGAPAAGGTPTTPGSAWGGGGGGGGGGGISSGGAASAGQYGGGINSTGQGVAGGSPGAINANGGAGSSAPNIFELAAGAGGGGGGAAATGVAGNGGVGGSYAGGGGGGGSALNGLTAGAGGNGAGGAVYIVEFF